MSPFWFLIFQPLGLSTPQPLTGAHAEAVCVGFTGSESMCIGAMGYERINIGFTGPVSQDIAFTGYERINIGFTGSEKQDVV